MAKSNFRKSTFASRQRERARGSTGLQCDRSERHGNQDILTPPPEPLGNTPPTQPVGPDPSGSSSSHNSRPLSVQGADVPSDPNAGPQELASDSADPQTQQSQPSTTDQILTESGVTSNGDNLNPTIQISPVGKPDEPQPTPDVAGTPTGATADPPPPYPEPHGGDEPSPRERQPGNVRPAQAGSSQSTYFSSQDRYEYRAPRHSNEQPLSGLPRFIGSSGHQPRYAPSP